MLYERVVLRDGVLEIELRRDFTYRLRYGDLVEYVPGWRRVRGRGAAYRFRSVEQLRYDFEQDVKHARGA